MFINASIELINSTPFVPLQFEALDTQRNLFGVLLVQGSFEIIDKHRLKLKSQQAPLQFDDLYFGESHRSSLKREGCLAPYKPKTDVVLEATAYSPSRAKESEWISSIRIGNRHKRFRVTGPRYWESKLGLPTLSRIEPIASLDVRYEYAFGGGVSEDARYLDNPIGTGNVEKFCNGPILCPQLLPEDTTAPIFASDIGVVGLGPIAPGWGSRLRHCGALSADWQATTAPYLPSDFSFEFYNVAPPDLRFAPFLRGNELIELINLDSSRHLRFGLPEIEMITLIEFEDGRLVPGPMNLDTVELVIEERKAHLTWRGIFPAQIPTKRIEIRMSAPSHMVE